VVDMDIAHTPRLAAPAHDKYLSRGFR
jgi:hypothetical protein